MTEDPRVISSAVWQHFKPLIIIVAVIAAACGPALFFHGAAFWGVMLAWWVFLVLALALAARFIPRKPRQDRPSVRR